MAKKKNTFSIYWIYALLGVSIIAFQYGFVMGMDHLAAGLTAPIFSSLGDRIGAKYLYNFGAFAQALTSIGQGFTVYVENTYAFLGLSYLCR